MGLFLLFLPYAQSGAGKTATQSPASPAGPAGGQAPPARPQAPNKAAQPPAPSKPAQPPSPQKPAQPPATAKPGASTAPATPQSHPLAQPPPAFTGVDAEPNPCLPGQMVHFWLPEGTVKAEAFNGRFGPGYSISGRDPNLTDQPLRDTTYKFDVWARLPAGAGGSSSAAPQKRVIMVTVRVLRGKYPHFATYTSPYHWSIDAQEGWNRNQVYLADPSMNAIDYFQPHEDSAERIGVTVLPAANQTAASLMQKVMDDAPTNYDVIKDEKQGYTVQCAEPAAWTTFDGEDQDDGDVPTRTIVLTFIYGPRAYVISGRTHQGAGPQEENLIHALVRSFDPVAPALQSK